MAGDTELLFSFSLPSKSFPNCYLKKKKKETLRLHLLDSAHNPLCDGEAETGGDSENVFQTLLIKMPVGELTPSVCLSWKQ